MNQATMRCAVFGANGYIGRHLVDSLLQAGMQVIAFDAQDLSLTPGIDYQKVDITDRSMLDEINWDVAAVYMFAGITGTYDGFTDYKKFTLVNEIGLLNVLTSIRHSPFRPKVIFPSTRLVYQGADSALPEDAPKAPKTIYATNKLACEYILEEYSNVFDIDYTIYRICVPYGNRSGYNMSYGTIGVFLKQARDNSHITLYGDGSLRRTFTHVDDICTQIITTGHDVKSRNEIFNIIGEDYSLRDVATIIAKKYSAEISYMKWPDEQLRIESGHTVFSGEKLRTRFNIDISYNLASWIDSLNISE